MFLKFFFIICTLVIPALNSFDKVVIWGHKLHSHTHSYIHEGFYRAFKYMGYITYWFDSTDDTRNFDFSHSLFLTEGQVDKNIPLREDCSYILHNCDTTKYKDLFAQGRCINLQVYTDDALKNNHSVKIDTCIYYDLPGKCLYQPWATDQLPHEVEFAKKQYAGKKQTRTRTIHWVGTIGDGKFGNINQINPFKNACRENNINFSHTSNVSMEENRLLNQKSYMAPTIVGKWQQEVGYIPCRIFKTIGSGHMGITNSLRVYELFDKKIVFNINTHQLFFDAQKRLATVTTDEMHELMDIVKKQHTYVNRIDTILAFLQLVQESHENIKRFYPIK